MAKEILFEQDARAKMLAGVDGAIRELAPEANLFDAVCENVAVLIKPRVSPPSVLLSGGVSRSRRVRQTFARLLEKGGLELQPWSARDLFLEALGCALIAATAEAGDALILTKPLGTGIITTGIKKGLVSPEIVEKTIELMAELNRAASEVMVEVGASACTDVTGFGLMGHLSETFVICPEQDVITGNNRCEDGKIVPL